MLDMFDYLRRCEPDISYKIVYPHPRVHGKSEIQE